MQAFEFPALWVGYVNTGNFKALIDLYADNAVLLATFSPNYLNDKVEIIDYFKNLALRKNLHVHLETNTIISQDINNSAYVITGTYSFSFESNNKVFTFPSRYTFVIDLTKSKPILHHHSSQLPTAL